MNSLAMQWNRFLYAGIGNAFTLVGIDRLSDEMPTHSIAQIGGMTAGALLANARRPAEDTATSRTEAAAWGGMLALGTHVVAAVVEYKTGSRPREFYATEIGIYGLSTIITAIAAAIAVPGRRPKHLRGRPSR